MTRKWTKKSRNDIARRIELVNVRFARGKGLTTRTQVDKNK
jgi:hypothetical protein